MDDWKGDDWKSSVLPPDLFAGTSFGVEQTRSGPYASHVSTSPSLPDRNAARRVHPATVRPSFTPVIKSVSASASPCR